jgi:[ribosomal protein S5]-alanine N-acetyltransferase
MNVHIETPRLIIRPLEEKDTEGMYLMDSDPEVHRYVGQHPVTTREESKDVIAFIRRQYEDHGIGRWAVLEKSTGDFVGWTGFKRMKEVANGHTDHLDFGYRLAQRHWGKGYATEASRAALHYGINIMGLTDIYAMTDPDNAASRHVLEKLGFRLAEIFPYDSASPWRPQGAPTTWFVYDPLKQ